MVEKKYIVIGTLFMYSFLSMSTGSRKANNNLKTLNDTKSLDLNTISDNRRIKKSDSISISDYDTDSTILSTESSNYSDTEDLRDYVYAK